MSFTAFEQNLGMNSHLQYIKVGIQLENYECTKNRSNIVKKGGIIIIMNVRRQDTVKSRKMQNVKFNYAVFFAVKSEIEEFEKVN